MSKPAATQYDDELAFLRKLVVGIGEVAEITGIPQRQIRYWEQKGIIASMNRTSSVRRYDYYAVKKMLLIKEMLDEGYTLDAAAQKVDKRLESVNAVFERLTARHS